jgi:hypothetical protein
VQSRFKKKNKTNKHETEGELLGRAKGSAGMGERGKQKVIGDEYDQSVLLQVRKCHNITH